MEMGLVGEAHPIMGHNGSHRWTRRYGSVNMFIRGCSTVGDSEHFLISSLYKDLWTGNNSVDNL